MLRAASADPHLRRARKETMPPLNDAIARPSMCPFCGGKAIDTLAKVITVTTYWRCRECDKTWTIASQTASPRRT
jgi:ribosomal protein L37AE/L43A